MPDFITNIIAKDDSTATINKIKNGFESIASTNKDLEKIKNTFDKITNSTKPVKMQLRELQQLMVNMNVKGLSNTDVFTEVAQRAGELRDAMSDASQAVNAYADDTFKLRATIETFQGVASAVSLSTSAMALFGKENKDVERALLKVQAAMGMLNSLQQIANLLNKDSALMLRIKQIRLEVAAASERKYAAATVAATAAEKIQNATTKTGGVIQNTWNVAMAVGKALLGDFSGLVLVAAGAVTTLAIATSLSSDNLDDMSKSTEDAGKETKKFAQTAQDEYARLMTSYNQLKNEWNQLSNEHEKNKWITENASKLNDLELSIVDVNSAERVFNGNTDAVVQAFVQRARAAARLAQLTEEYRKQMEIIDRMNDISVKIKADADKRGRHANEGDEIKDTSYHSSRYGRYDVNSGKWFFTQQGAKLYSGTDVSTNPEMIKLEKELNASQDRTNRIAEEIAADIDKTPKITTDSSTNSHTTRPPKEEVITYQPGSINAMRDEYSEKEKQLKDGIITEDKIQSTIARLKELKELIEKEEIRLGFKIDPETIKVEEEKKKIEEQLKKLGEDELEIEIKPKVSSFNKAIGKTQDLNNLTGIEDQMNFNDRLLQQLNALAAAYALLGDAGTEGFNRINEKIKEVTESQNELGTKAAEINEEEKKKEEQIETLNKIGDAASQTGDSLKQMGDAVNNQGIQAAGIIAEAIANIILGYSKASAQAGALGPIGWAAFSLSGLAQIVAVISQIKSLGAYANGGIVRGNTTIGDYNLARVNKGEMILADRQQQNLFNILDKGLSYNTKTGEVVFKIKGKTLVGVQHNYDDKMNKII